jgi:hypothetical protein
MTMGKELNPMLPGPASNTTRLPLLLDICLNISLIFVLLVAITTAILSILAKADVLTVILRTAIAILAVGLPVYVLNYLIGRYFIQATLEAIKMNQEVKAEQEKSSGELEIQA